MHGSLLVLAGAALAPAVLGDRGSPPIVPPTVCNNEPDDPGPFPNPANLTTTFKRGVPKISLQARKAEQMDRRRRIIADRASHRLGKRGGTVTFADSCNNAPPANSGYKPDDGFATMTVVLQQAYNDAVTLANLAQGVDGNNFGFTHYFGGNKADLQLQHFQGMMAAIASSDTNYNIQFECENVPSCAGAQSVFVTDSTPGLANDQKIIEVCPRFWTAPTTKYFLYNSNTVSPTPPWRNNDASNQGWCGKSNANGDTNVSRRVNQYFATAGHSVLHELTHLDSLASAAGLDASTEPSENGAHGTDDIQNGCEMAGARQFLADYNSGNTDDASPDYNAESYAAAATEIYFMDLCGFSQIRPVTS